MHPRWVKQSRKRKTRKWQLVPGDKFLHKYLLPEIGQGLAGPRQQFLWGTDPSLQRHIWVNASLTQIGQRGKGQFMLYQSFSNFVPKKTSMAFGPADGFSSSLPQEFCILCQKVLMLLPLQIRTPFCFSAFHKVNGYVQQWLGWNPRLWGHRQDQDGASDYMLARHQLAPPQGSVQSASLSRPVFFALRFTQSRAKRNHLVGNKNIK